MIRCKFSYSLALDRHVAERIDDEPFLRLIKKWLKAGVLETEGQVLRPESGTPKRYIRVERLSRTKSNAHRRPW